MRSDIISVMVNFPVFSVVVSGFLIALFILAGRRKTRSLFDWAVLLTIAIYRVTTYAYLALGGNFSAWKQANNAEFLDHKWLGMIIVVGILTFWRKNHSSYRTVLLAIGTGMILDEISEVLAFVGIPFPAGFRDSLPDLVLILASYVVFLAVKHGIILPVIKRRGSVPAG